MGASVSVDNLGENVTNAEEARQSAALYHRMLDQTGLRIIDGIGSTFGSGMYPYIVLYTPAAAGYLLAGWAGLSVAVTAGTAAAMVVEISDSLSMVAEISLMAPTDSSVAPWIPETC